MKFPATYTGIDNGDGTVTLTLHGGTGCAYRYSVVGNTATLLPNQTCRVVDGKQTLVVRFERGGETLVGESKMIGKYVYSFTGTERKVDDGGARDVAVGGTGLGDGDCTRQ